METDTQLKDPLVKQFYTSNSVTVVKKLEMDTLPRYLICPNTSYMFILDKHLVLMLHDDLEDTWRIVIRDADRLVTRIETTYKLGLFGKSSKNKIDFYLKDKYKSSIRKRKYEYPILRINKKTKLIKNKRIITNLNDRVKHIYMVKKSTDK